jgi:protein-L-isoaspartate(D-aspartate) O-methyltransferase
MSEPSDRAGRPARFPLALERIGRNGGPSPAAEGSGKAPAVRVGAGPAGPMQGPAPSAAPTSRGKATPPELLRPQRPLQQAAQAAEAARRSAAVTAGGGYGLDSAAVRARMVARLRAGGLDCEPVLQALASVPRHAFVDTALAAQAYEDTSLPIGLSQTISKPSIVGRMLALLFATEAARQRGHLGRVLEIGTGCGYQTALLARLARSVVSIERLKPLHERARTHLVGLRAVDVRLVHGDGRLGHPPRAPYDTIIAAAGGEALPPA